MLAEALHIDAERALNLFYTTNVYQQLSDPKYGLQLMSDDYILENLIEQVLYIISGQQGREARTDTHGRVYGQAVRV